MSKDALAYVKRFIGPYLETETKIDRREVTRIMRFPKEGRLFAT